MREALGPEMGSDVVESAGAIAAPQPRSVIRWVLLAVAAIVVLQVLAAFVFPPRGHDGEPYRYPTDGMVGANIELPAPHVVFDPTPETPPSHELLTFDITITNTLFTGWIIMVIIVVLVWFMSRGIKVKPTGKQNAVEYVYEGLANFATSLGGPKARIYVPVFAALFLFILLTNWSGLVPPVGRIHEVRAPTSDVNVTFGLALFAFFMFHIEGVRALGIGGYLGKFFSLRAFREEGFAAGSDRPVRGRHRIPARVHQAGHAGNATLRQHLRRRGGAGRDHRPDDRHRARSRCLAWRSCSTSCRHSSFRS